MAFDGFIIANIVHELREKLVGGRIEKISQPESEEIVLAVRNNNGNHKLLLTSNASHPRICLTETAKDNPMTAPLFCMVLRKHLKSGRIVDITQPDFERIVHIKIEAVNEMGYMTNKTLIAEIMGKHSNVILVSDDGIILDSSKHISFDKSSVREVLPGKKYENPPSQNKLNPMFFDESAFYEKAKASPGTKIQSLVYQGYTGISPVSASELCCRADIDASCYCGEADSRALERLAGEMRSLFDDTKNGVFRPVVYFDEKKTAVEFSAFELRHFLVYNKTNYESVSQAVELFYSERRGSSSVNQKNRDTAKLVKSNIERCLKKRELLEVSFKETENREQYRIYGELLRANIYLAEKGMTELTVQNYFDPECRNITLELDKDKTPSENMQSYFKLYNKLKRTYSAVLQQTDQNNEEIAYFESVLDSLENCSSDADIDEIKAELAGGGYAGKKSGKQQKKKKTGPLRYTATDGTLIYVGKNNIQNDELTLKTAMPYDIWLHTKNIPGSHVIIKLDGKSASDQTITEAAKLACYHSKARGAVPTAVDYCQRKYVKKPAGAKPGKVIYDNYKTAYVSCDKEEAEKMLTKQ